MGPIKNGGNREIATEYVYLGFSLMNKDQLQDEQKKSSCPFSKLGCFLSLSHLIMIAALFIFVTDIYFGFEKIGQINNPYGVKINVTSLYIQIFSQALFKPLVLLALAKMLYYKKKEYSDCAGQQGCTPKQPNSNEGE